MDNYQILGVSKDITDEELKKRIKTLAKQYHPDANVGNEKEAEEKFKEAMEAYQNIIKERQNGISNNTTDSNSSSKSKSNSNNDDWIKKSNEYKSKIAELAKQQAAMKKKEEKAKDDLRFANSEYNTWGIERNHYYGEIRISLINLINEANNYYYSKIEEMNHSLLKTFKKEARLEIEKESKEIIDLLKNTQELIEDYYQDEDDSLLFTINFKKEEIDILQRIALKEFNKFIASLQDYQKKQAEITENREKYSNEIIRLENKLEELKPLLQEIAKKIDNLKKLEQNFYDSLFNNIDFEVVFGSVFNNTYSSGRR